jgi:Dyp-type peroxidase family
MSDGREHFGFRDGISQPNFLSIHRKDDKVQTIAPGEFIFGYKDESQGISKVPPFGENGSYLVIRQLEQDVEGFWKYVNEMSKRIDLSNINLAEKMVGRRMDGSALGRDFTTKELFFGDDKLGIKCPLGSHVRRANLREWANENPMLAIQRMKRHRMVRRGRSYGSPGLKSWYPTNIDIGVDQLQNAQSSRGLLFMSLQVDIERQFELILHDWLQNPKFAGLTDDIDPITHNDVEIRGKSFQNTQKYFSIPRKDKVPLRIPLQTFVRTRGTAYFFLPGKLGLHQIINPIKK